ncbi:low specificity L-threonine aldolase [Amycolatopsis sp. NPDC023774]|uniref:threonine aldolase family protein n=1 Tax=Amycolatopsis sp. NPDC023774 TaxID=3155015 RepID=UPI0033D8CB7A
MSLSTTTAAPAISFTSDNIAGASPTIIEAVAAAAGGSAPPYGADDSTVAVKHKLSRIFEREVDVLLVSTGSAANALCLATLTPPWGSVLCHSDSHINNDECGAPEFFTAGAKLVPMSGNDAKIDPTQLRKAVNRKVGDVHSVQPATLSITQATESGSVYTLDEIHELTRIARAADMRVHMDGARFANAVVSLGCTPAEMTWRAGVDALSLGATKNGAMTADVIVMFDQTSADEAAYRHKRAGQLASKMRFQAAQIVAYLEDDLWLRNARHANMMASRLAQGLNHTPGVGVLGTPQANIVFCQLPPQLINGLLARGYTFYHDRWEPGTTRFVTSFATTTEEIDGLLSSIRRLAG